MSHDDIDINSLKKGIPLWQDSWLPRLKHLRFHHSAPKWTAECSDHQTIEDQNFVLEYQKALKLPREAQGPIPAKPMLEWIFRQAKTNLFFQRQLHGLDLVNQASKDWEKIPPMTREDLQKHIHLIIPQDAELSRLIVNPTSGTTGQPIPCPSHPRAQGCYDPLDLFAMEQHGLEIPADTLAPLGIQLCYQKQTIVYNTIHSFTGGRGFAKVNIHPDVWDPMEAASYLLDMNPAFLSGDPFAFLMAKRLGIKSRPQVLLSTALTLTFEARKEIEDWFSAPICDIYSLNETAPLAYSDPKDPNRFILLPHDIFIEILDDEGHTVPEGKVGNIAVTGGRNPFIPLLRYLTGDRAAHIREPKSIITDFQGRKSVSFTTGTGKILNSIDLARILRSFPIYFHRFTQKKELSCVLDIAAPGISPEKIVELHTQITQCIEDLPLIIRQDFDPKGEKFLPFVQEGAIVG